jgi:nicotinic acid mononucleotide adenylyltransferase
VLHTPSSNVSSTDVRFQLALRQEPGEHAVDKCVASYALQKQLYCNASTNDHARS